MAELTIVSDALQDIFERHGELSAEIVLKEATAEDSPLHGYFEWKDGAAAHQYRLIQAGQLIRRVKLTVVRPEPEPPRKIRKWTHVEGNEEREPRYLPTEQALADPETRESVLRRMRGEIESLTRRYGYLQEFAAAMIEAAEAATAAMIEAAEASKRQVKRKSP